MDIIVGENSGDDFTTVNAAFAEVLKMGTLSELVHIKMRESDAIFIPNQKININGITTTAQNKIVLSLYDTYSDKNRIDSNAVLKPAAGLGDLFQIRNGCNHIEFKDFNALLESSCSLFADYRTAVDASSKILVSRIYNNLVNGATANRIFTASSVAPSKSILIENCNFKASSHGITGSNTTRDAVQVVNTKTHSTRGSNSGTHGMRYVEVNKTYSAGFGGASGYLNYLDLAPASADYAADDRSGSSSTLDNVALSAAYADADNENWFYATNSPLEGGAADGSNVAFMRPTPVASSPVLSGTISVESKTDTGFTVRARSDIEATAQVVITTPAATQPTDAAFDASALKATSTGTEDVLIAVTGQQAFTDYKIHLRFKPEAGNSSYYTLDVKTTPVAPSITSINGGNPLIPGVQFEIIGTGFTGHEAADIGGTAQTSFTVVSDTKVTAVAVRPNDLDNNVSGTLNVGGGTGSVTFISGAGWGSAVISTLASENLLPVTPALELGDKVYHESQNLDLNVYADGSYLLNSTNATEQVAVDIFRNGAWLDRQTVTLTSTGQSTNTAPVINSATTVNITAGQTLTYTATATDADAGDTVTLSYNDLPPGATVSSGTVTWVTAESTQSSTAVFNVVATDQSGATATQQVTVNIAATASQNTSPQLPADAVLNVIAGQTTTFTPQGTDTDGDPLTYTISAHPSYVSILNGIVQIAPPAGLSVQASFTLNVSDGKGGVDTQLVSMNITPPSNGGTVDNVAPVITLYGGTTEITLGQPFVEPVAAVSDNVGLADSTILKRTNYVEGQTGDFFIVYYGPTDTAGNQATPAVFEFTVKPIEGEEPKLAGISIDLIGPDEQPLSEARVNTRVLDASRNEVIPMASAFTNANGKLAVNSTSLNDGSTYYLEVHWPDGTYNGYTLVGRVLQ